MWEAIILSGKQSLLSFELFQSVQLTYSWMKYYNSELESNKNNSQEMGIDRTIRRCKKIG
ncbi:MAG: hypothetical protein ACE5SW_07795 [Nitrososphaeraceae archaeon]